MSDNNWLTVLINPPPMDKPIIARDKVSAFGYPHRYETFNFHSKIMCEDSVIGTLQNSSFIEWKFIEDEDAKGFNS